MAITKMSNSGIATGGSTKYDDMLAGNAAYMPYTDSFESIATFTATGSANSVTFSSIPQTYKHLHIRALIRNNANVGGDAAWIRINGDTSTSYPTWKWASYNQTATTYSVSSQAGYARYGINTADSNSRANYYSPIVMDIPNYSQSSYQKTLNAYSSGVGPTSVANYFSQSMGAVTWPQTAAITSITLGVWTVDGANTMSGLIELFGVKG